MEKIVSPWNVPVTAEKIPDGGLHFAIEAPAETRAALAKLAGVRELSQLSALFDLTRRGARVHVAGQVKALVGQNCVVTLDPIQREVDEAVDLVFAPPTAAGAEPDGKIDDDPPEPLIDGKLDLGAIAAEFLILGIDPYPRKSDAEFAPPHVDDEGAHPFAALEALKKRPGGGRA
jgi:uncharacterized metal-binding protein YceD (DUF177 family)